MTTRPSASGLWGRGFRPFFLGAAIHAAVSVPLWAAVWLGALGAPAWLAPTLWHGHEMIFGFVAAAIAGFLLTSAPVWTGGRALEGAPLAALAALWAAGRLALAGAGALPAWLVAALDGAFLPLLALALGRTLRGSGQRRNQALLVVVGALAIANLWVHAHALGMASGAPRALRFAVDGVVVLLLVIGGRIAPAFTQNALRRAGSDRVVRSPSGPNAVAIAAAAGLALADLFAPRSLATGGLATLAGVAAAARMAGWQSWQTRSDPLLWSLHGGMAWVALGLLLVGAGDLGAPVPAAAGLHALTAGGMGTTIVAVMTRVGLGHTGRPLEVPRRVVACYALVHAGALARVASAFATGEAHAALLAGGGLAWAGGFALFALLYAGILVGPRVDGRPG